MRERSDERNKRKIALRTHISGRASHTGHIGARAQRLGGNFTGAFAYFFPRPFALFAALRFTRISATSYWGKWCSLAQRKLQVTKGYLGFR
jgi:hypothetical protein